MTRIYQQLTYEQRCQMYALKTRGDSQRKIAEAVGVHQSTVSRELTRNGGGRGYRYKQAQEKAEHRRQAAAGPSQMTADLIGIIEAKLRED